MGELPVGAPFGMRVASLSSDYPVFVPRLNDAVPASKTRQPTGKSLGRVIATYRYRRTTRLWRWVYPGLAVVAVVAPFLHAIQRYNYGYTNHGESAAVAWSRPWFILAGFALLTALLSLAVRLRLAQRFIAIHQHGITLALSHKQAYRWEQLSGLVTEIRQPRLFGLSLQPKYRAVLIPNLGAPIRLSTALENLPDLLTRIKANLYPHILPDLKEQFIAGKWVYFGPIAIQRNYLRLRQRQIPWNQINQIRIDQGYLVIELHDLPRQRLAIGKIPNWEILLELIKMGASA